MCTPLPETVTWVPLVQAPPSSLYWVPATPEPASLAVKCTVTAPLVQAAVASSVVTGAVVSMRTVQLLLASTEPATSVER